MRIVLLFLASILSCSAQVGLRSPAFVSNLKPAAVSCTTLTCDVWQDFEFTTVNQSNLEAQDHNTACTWGVTDSLSKLTTSTTGELATIKCPQGTVDSGVKGFTVDCNLAVAVAAVDCTFPSETNNVSAGFWFKTASLTSTRYFFIQEFRNSGGDFCSGVYEWNNSGHKIYLNGSFGNATPVDVSADTWYWITHKYIKSGTCSMAVYDTGGSQVGSTATGTDGSNRIPNRSFLGLTQANATIDNVVIYFDDLVIDFTSAAFPLGP